ncbi:P-loop containing nucleoside triphosphate hydrolase protein [Epithele typhae]|uniref:P-loop containing nucleoside triphosphate hydrolase protein n=1 Tax=Epithele typhae TaxID=378194 RepID=UPI002007DF1D|nr:P-loop containing nucleoside triphosphate hydrolase protein [Epithele typhae]KAH9923989.1 P-loop containing nucleoside triphosphate hydrolase protein [Epithele typhae]
MAEIIYSKGTRVWFPDKELGWISAEVISNTKTDEAVKLVFTDERGKEIKIDTTVKAIKDGKEDLPPLRNPPLLETADDLATLSHLNEPSVLHTIRNRYAQHSIYTYSGIVLIAVNPFQRVALYGPEVIQAYNGRRRGELEPHLFAIAEDAYTAMTRDGTGQTIIVSGESGAGKTESAKFIMRYIASVNPPNAKVKVKAKASLDESSEVERQILATNPVLEAFGNAKTTRNDNSSRFGKYIQILFDGEQEIVGARIRTYLLERSRVVFQPMTERNYHIFYQLCAGAPLKERKDFGLDTDVSKFQYLCQGGPSSTPIPGVDDAEEFRQTQTALSTIGISVEKQWAVFKLLSSLLHLGNIKVTQSRNDATIDDADPALQLSTRFLGVPLAEFKKWTIKKQITTRSEKIVTSLNGAQATVVRDSVAKFVYACLFEWVVAVLNESLAGENGEAASRAEMFIGVLDIYGFEHFKKNSFEQFSINYANEKLQQEFNQHVFKLEQEEYVREKINWTFIDFSDNQPCIDVIEGKLGVMALLDEESRLPAGTDQSFLQKLNSQLTKPEHAKVFKKPRFGNSAFTIAHYALDVTYEVEGFLEKNRDTVPDEHMALLQATKNTFLKEVLDAAFAATKPADAAPPSPTVSDSASSTNRRASVIPDPGRVSIMSGGAAASSGPKRPGVTKKPTQASIFKASLVSLMETLNVTNVHYIRCIKPNEQKRAWEFTPQQVLGQLRACGVLETIRISCAGYPSRWTYEEFAERYYMLVHSSEWEPMIKNLELKPLCARILEKTINDPDKYQPGLTKIFFRAGMLAALESLRSNRLNSLVTIVQKNMRRKMAVKKYKQLREATIKIQTWWRGIMATRLVNRIRKDVAAIRLQRGIRRYLQRKRFLAIRMSVVSLQARARGALGRRLFKDSKRTFAVVTLQSLFRGLLSRRSFNKDVKNVILIQSCIRRRLARKELKSLKAEARSVSKFKEISYRLENKVVELTQNLQKRTEEKKELQNKVLTLEAQLLQAVSRHEESDARARQIQEQLNGVQEEVSRSQQLLRTKEDVERKLEEAITKAAEKEAAIQKLTEELAQQASQLETQQKLMDSQPVRNADDSSVIQTLKTEVSSLREQLNRATALNALTRGVRAEPTSPTFAPVLRLAEAPAAATNGQLANLNRSHQRRHSSAGVYAISPSDHRTSADELMFNAKRSQNANPRAVSVAYNGEDGLPQFRVLDRSSMFDDPAEEKIRLMQDIKRLDEDVLDGLVRGLKIPAPSLTSPAAVKEILFPANLISLITNEMWKYGLIPESERFLANVMQTIQSHVMSFTSEDAIIPGIFWLSNVHEMLSFICVAESDMLQGIGPGEENAVRPFEWPDYERLVSVVKHDLDSLEYNIYHTWMLETKKRLSKMVIPALIESQSLPGFTTTDGGGRLFNRLLNSNTQPAYSMDDILNLLNKVWRSLKSYYMEETVVQQVITELLKLIGVTSFNDLLMRRNFSSWKRAMQIQYNITRIEEWCKSHDMPEGTLQLEHLMQATKLLQLKKSTPADLEIIYDVCWMLTPTQIQRMCTNYYVADYETPISPEILRVVASRVSPNDRNDHLLLAPETEEVGPYELPLPREVSGLETYVPAYLNVPHLRRLAALVA